MYSIAFEDACTIMDLAVGSSNIRCFFERVVKGVICWRTSSIMLSMLGMRRLAFITLSLLLSHARTHVQTRTTNGDACITPKKAGRGHGQNWRLGSVD